MRVNHLQSEEKSESEISVSLVAALQMMASPTFIEARDFLVRGRFDEAEIRLDALLATEPANPVAQCLRADIDLRRELFGSAVERLRLLLKSAPGYLAALHGLGFALFKQGQLSKAEAEATQLLSLDPTNFSGRLLRAGIAMASGDQNVAAMLYRGILGERPGHLPSILGLGHCLRIIGDANGAIAMYRQALDHDPRCAEAWSCLGSMKTHNFATPDITALEHLAARTDLPLPERLFVHFALGKAYFDKREDARAFTHYAEGKAIARATVPADQISQEEWEAWIAHTTAEGREKGNRRSEKLSQDACDVPIFIVGMPRAGSTLVEQIIGSHPRVEATSELPYLDMIARRIVGRGDNLRLLDRTALAEEYLAAVRAHRKTDKPWFIDKLPANWRHVSLIKMILPQARIVDVRRYPLASCVGVFRQHFLGIRELAGSLSETAKLWCDYASSMRQFETTWPEAVYRIRYEDLVTDTKPQIRSLLSALGLPFDKACLHWFDNGQPVRTPSSEQVRQPIFTHGLDDWRRFEPWLSEARLLLADEILYWDKR